MVASSTVMRMSFLNSAGLLHQPKRRRLNATTALSPARFCSFTNLKQNTRGQIQGL
jgi:hypothetical protein